jgi:outer membrane immunogenic protein
MRVIVGATVSLALTGAVSGAMTDTPLAAEYYTVASPLDGHSWAGPYLGIAAGYQWTTAGYNPTGPSGFSGRIEAGDNWQNGALAFGDGTGIELSAADDTISPWQFSDPWFGTIPTAFAPALIPASDPGAVAAKKVARFVRPGGTLSVFRR